MGVFSFGLDSRKKVRNSLEGGVLESKTDAPSSTIERVALYQAPASAKGKDNSYGSRRGSRTSTGSAGLPSPMSALPSPTLADLSASFLQNDDSPNVVSTSDGNGSDVGTLDSTRSSTSSSKSR